MRGRPWDADQLERTVRNLREVRTEIDYRIGTLRERGWGHLQLENLFEADRTLAEAQLALASAADRMRHRQVEEGNEP